MMEATPSRPGDYGGGASFEETLKSIDNEAVRCFFSYTDVVPIILLIRYHSRTSP